MLQPDLLSRSAAGSDGEQRLCERPRRILAAFRCLTGAVSCTKSSRRGCDCLQAPDSPHVRSPSEALKPARAANRSPSSPGTDEPFQLHQRRSQTQRQPPPGQPCTGGFGEVYEQLLQRYYTQGKGKTLICTKLHTAEKHPQVVTINMVTQHR